MNPWTFYDFLGSRGENLIRLWLDSLPEKASAKIDARILFMRVTRIWPEQYVSGLKGWPRLVELRVTSAGNQYRPVGFYGPARGEFTLVLGVIKKGKLRQETLEKADANRIIVLSDRSRIVEHVFHQRATNSELPNE